MTYLFYLNCCYCNGTSITYANEALLIVVIYLHSSSLLWAGLTLAHAKHNLRLAVGGSWSLARLSTVNQTPSLFGPVCIGTGNQTKGLLPLGRALAGLGQALGPSQPITCFYRCATGRPDPAWPGNGPARPNGGRADKA